MVKFLKLGNNLFNINEIKAIGYNGYGNIQVCTNKTTYTVENIKFKDLLKHPEIKKMITIEIKEREE